MMPPSWKAEIEETVEKAAHSSSERQRTESEKNSADISTAIKSFVGAYNAQHNKPERKDQVKRFIEIAGFFLLVGTVVFTGLSWWVFRGQLAISKDTEIRQLRAYVGTTDKPVDLRCADCENPPRVDQNWDRNFLGMEIKNFGQTPAYKVTGRINFKDMPYGQRIPKDFDYADDPLDESTYPMSESSLNPQEITRPGNTLGPDHITLIKRARNHEITLYAFGHIDFVDAFHKKRSVPYCMRYFPDTKEADHQWGACPDHNNPNEDDP